MSFRTSLITLRSVLCGTALLVVAVAVAQATPSPVAKGGTSVKAAHSFVVSGNQFLFDGKPYQVISGEMHYTRIPRTYWRDRFRKARAMGLNTITTYAFWNAQEPRPGIYDFTGQNDIAEYIREAQEEGLNIDRSLVLRSDDPKYIAAMQAWFTRLGKEIAPLLIQNGGPVIAVQVENEYGSFGDDHAYMETVKSTLQKSRS